MQNLLRQHAEIIYKTAISENMPNEAVKRAIVNNYEKIVTDSGKLLVVSIGKAGWEMAKTANELLGERIHGGVVITKYNHSRGELNPLEIYEAGHPVVDFNGISSTKRALELTEGLCENDTVLFLVSGGGSALFESVDCPLEKMQALTTALLKSGANINEINAIRKHISNVKGGGFARHVYPAHVFAVVLSDVVGNDLSTIASGPACRDATTVEYCLEILQKYNICVDEELLSLIKRETPKEITNSTHVVSGSVTELCQSAMACAQSLGYNATVVDDNVTCRAIDISRQIEKLAKDNREAKVPLAFVFGGEVTIEVQGNGKGGRNQELALLCAEKISGYGNMAVLCVGSDGTDGPTDMAGGYVDGNSWENIAKSGKSPTMYLKNNDSYNALGLTNGLIFTGPTGTNVNDIYILLVQPQGKDFK